MAVILVIGASRGIGLAIALRAACDGANVAIAAKSAVPNPKLSGTIYTAADAVTAGDVFRLHVVPDKARYGEAGTAAAGLEGAVFLYIA